jgi:integrase
MARHRGRGSRYIHLLEDPQVQRWYDNVARGSVITADVYLRRLGNFCELMGISPKGLAKKSEKKLYELFLDLISQMERDEKAGSYINSIIKALKSWLLHNDKVINRRIRIRDAEATPTLKEERIPTIPELKGLFLSADKKNRAVIALLAHSGIRLEVIGNYLGVDGLQCKDLEEMRIKSNTIEFKNIPTKVMVRAELSKSRKNYITFLSEEGCGYLKDYLEERLRLGEKFTKNTAIISPKKSKKNFITTTKVGDGIRTVIRKAGFRWRPYVLRSFFGTQMMLAESKGRSLRDYRTFWMGHKGDIEHTYTMNKGILPPHIIDDMRAAYKRSEEFLQTTSPTGPSGEEWDRMIRKQFLEMSGMSEQEIDKEGILDLPKKDFFKLTQERFYARENGDNGNGSQKAISIEDVERYLEEGWEFVKELSNEKVIVRHG